MVFDSRRTVNSFVLTFAYPNPRLLGRMLLFYHGRACTCGGLLVNLCSDRGTVRPIAGGRRKPSFGKAKAEPVEATRERKNGRVFPRPAMTSLKIVPLAGKGEGVLEIHRSVKSALRGQAILHLETRLSEEELNRHVQSRILVWTLRAMELAVEPPEICFHRVSETSGLDMVESLRGVSHGAQ